MVKTEGKDIFILHKKGVIIAHVDICVNNLFLFRFKKNMNTIKYIAETLKYGRASTI